MAQEKKVTEEKITENVSTEYLGNLLSERGVKPSIQRLSVLKYLISKKNHPSVDVIYQYLHKEIPTLSKTTVYNTLNLLVDKGIVTALSIKEGEVLYDFIEYPHAHFLCTKCGNIYDIKIDNQIFNIKTFEGFHIEESQINLRGICSNCKN